MATPISATEDEDSFVMMNLETQRGEDEFGPPALKLSVAPKHNVVGTDVKMSTTQVCATLLARELDASKYENDAKRAPVDIVVALDISGSMHGDKLERSKATLKLLLRCLSAEDRFGLVTFSDEAKVEIKLSKLGSNQNKEVLMAKIQSLQVEGCTNISGALGLASQELQSIRDGCHNVRCVFLLSDGCANRGVTGKAALMKIAQGCFNVGEAISGKRANTTLHCFEYGNDHDAEVMQGLAEETQGGTYYFVEGDSDVVTAFGDALGGVLSVVAQNVTLRIKPNTEKGVKIQDVLHDRKRIESDGSFTVSLGDFYAGESRDVLFSVTLSTPNAPPDSEPIVHATASFSYLDLLRNNLILDDFSAGAVCSIARPTGVEFSSPNQSVLLQWLRVKTTEILKSSDDMCKKGDFSGAREILRSWLSTLEGQPKDPLLQHLASDVKEVLGTLQDETSYGLVGSKTMNRVHYGHKTQRCAGMSASQQARNTYATCSKKRYLHTTLNMSKAEKK